MKVNFDPLKDDPKEFLKRLKEVESKEDKFKKDLPMAFAKRALTHIEANSKEIMGMSGLGGSREVAALAHTQSSVANNNEINEVSSSHVKVLNTTEEATYAEFGTGMIGSGTPHPRGDMGWEYDVNDHGVKGWRFIGQDGGLVHTLGYPSFATYHNSFNQTKEELPDIAKEVFKGVFGDDEK